MNPTAFCFWFKGVLDISATAEGSISFDPERAEILRERLGATIKHIKQTNEADTAQGGLQKPSRPPVARC